MQHDKPNGQGIGGRTRLNARVLMTLGLALAVVLAGCAGISGLGGDSGNDSASDGVAEADTPSGDGAGDDGANDDVATTVNSDDSEAGDGDNQSSDDVTVNDSTADDTTSSNGGADSSSVSSALDSEEEWFNLSKPGRYVFEIESAEEGTGSMSFETTEVSNGQATVSFQYDLGEESFESTVTGPVGEVEPQIATSPAYAYLTAIRLGGVTAGMLSGGEDLQVGNEFSQQSAEGSMHIEVTGTDSYAGVECYVIESRVNETLTQETCTQQAFSSAPYVAFYDENGNLEQRIELVEYERE
ncbi:hypothetical protein [Halococcus saccharolyticus]|uniref:Uncharacterized protein n=1 Tax=Halococcus saccharolyticus DSM 5350 TaxID=1227455 RepID=M0MD08_9EURY|nr:hypothetical protein [Halococcus saccharolyticus]EMA43621.1 hypothetical protein C449_13717 [Halococcus saccharolyticus DSM 5350]